MLITYTLRRTSLLLLISISRDLTFCGSRLHCITQQRPIRMARSYFSSYTLNSSTLILFLTPAFFWLHCKFIKLYLCALQCFRASRTPPHPHVVAQGAQGVRHAGHRARRLPHLLAAILHLVPHNHPMRNPLLSLPRYLSTIITHVVKAVLYRN